MIAMASNGHLKYHIVQMRKNARGISWKSHALFDADAAPDAKKLGDERDLVRGLHLDTEFACKKRYFTLQLLRAHTEAFFGGSHRPIFTTGHDYVCVFFERERGRG